MIAAAYVTLTLISAALGLSSGAIQVRFSEALCVLPIFTPYAIPGVSVGCLLANIFCGGTVYDIVLGTLATVLSAILTRLLKNRPLLSSIPTLLTNTAVIPFVLILSGVGGMNMYPFFALTVFVGELISCSVFGTLLAVYIKQHRRISSMLFK